MPQASAAVWATTTIGRTGPRRQRDPPAARLANTVETYFELDDASQVWDYVPAFKGAPELLEDPGPALVVLFSGEYTGGWRGANGGPAKAQQVMCVATPNHVNVYLDVSRSGFRKPSG